VEVPDVDHVFQIEGKGMEEVVGRKPDKMDAVFSTTSSVPLALK
jgi:hypothetical protein